MLVIVRRTSRVFIFVILVVSNNPTSQDTPKRTVYTTNAGMPVINF